MKVRKMLLSPLEKVLSKTLSFLFRRRWGREFIYSSLPKNQLLLCNTDEGIRYVVNSSDNVIGLSVFKTQQSFDARHLISSLSLLGGQKHTLLDVGANIGTIGIYAVSQGLVKKCLAFEPEPNNFELLNINVRINNLSEKFELYNVALASEKTAPLSFELSATNFGDHRVRVSNSQGIHNEQERELISVVTDTLNRACERIDLDDCILFMDTQGFEGDVLSGANNLIAAGVPIVTEFWPYGLIRSEGTEKFYTALSQANYTALYDLRYPNSRIDFSVEAIKKIASDLGDDGPFTDLLMF